MRPNRSWKKETIENDQISLHNSKGPKKTHLYVRDRNPYASARVWTQESAWNAMHHAALHDALNVHSLLAVAVVVAVVIDPVGFGMRAVQDWHTDCMCHKVCLC